MPEHRHGLPTGPRVTRNLGNGDYLAEGVKHRQATDRGIAVVHVDTEEPCSYRRSFARNSAMALGVLDAAFIAGRQRRRLGDYIGGTKVIQLAKTH